MSDGEWRLPDDPRSFQIAALLALLVYGMLALDFDVAPARAGLILATALAAQWAFGRLAGLPVYDPRSALISGLSLCLLLRTGSDLLAATAAVLAVASKFVLRVRGKHVFNPTNAAIATVVLTTGAAWVSPGQWGDSAFLAFLVACAGGLVAWRALRSDVALAFLLSWVFLLFGRALYLGDPLAIPAPPAPERQPAALRLLHDLRPQDDPRCAGVPRGLRRPRGPSRLLPPVRAVPAERRARSRSLRPHPSRARPGPSVARPSLRVAGPFERSRSCRDAAPPARPSCLSS